MIEINLTQGLTDNDQYKAWKFDGGEIHFKLKDNRDLPFEDFLVRSRINSSDDLMLLILAVDALKKDYAGTVHVFLPYFPYAQADRDFGKGECFSLKTVTKLLNTLDVHSWSLFDVHSDVAPSLMNGFIQRLDNSKFITNVLFDIGNTFPDRLVDEEIQTNQGLFYDKRVLENLIWLSPDAGAYKKIGKLADVIGWKGEVAAANKYRNTVSGSIDSLELSKQDFEGKDILIIDDICMKGGTFIGLAKKLRERNVGKLYLAVSHMINQKINNDLVDAFDKIFTTNSRFDEYEYTATPGQENTVQVYKII